MLAVGIGVREDADAVIAQPRDVIRGGLDTERDRDVVHFLRGEQLAGRDLPGVEDLAAQWHHGLELAVARLLGGAAGGITLDQEEFRTRGILAGAVGELAGQRRAAHDALARDLLARLDALLRVCDGEPRDSLARFRVLVEPEHELVLDDPRDEGRRLAGSQAFLGLPGELRIAHLRRQHVARIVPDVLRRELDSARDQAAELAELADRLGEPEPEAVYVRPTLERRDQVDIALLDPRPTVHPPDDGPVDALLLALDAADERLLGQPFAGGERFAQVLREPARVLPLLLLTALLDREADLEARAEHRLGLEHVLELRQRDLGAVEVRGIGPEAHRRSGVVLADVAHHFELRVDLSVAEGDVVFLAAAPHPALEVLGKRVHHRHADAVQAAGELVGALGELPARVQTGQDQLDTAHLLLRMDVDRHAATVVAHLDRAVLVHGHVDAAAMTDQRLVDAVVDHFVGEMVRPTGVGVHARPAPDGLEAAQDFDVLRGVGLAHR